MLRYTSLPHTPSKRSTRAVHDVSKDLRRIKGIDVPLVGKLLATYRDRLIGFARAFRRSEPVGMDVADVAISAEWLRITIRRSKGDQEGEGQVIAVRRTGTETCPALAYEAWVAAAGVRTGRVFRSMNRHGHLGDRLSTNAVAEIVQRRAKLAGLDETSFSWHPMRAGFANSAAIKALNSTLSWARRGIAQ